MKKKIICILMIITMLFSLAACGKKNYISEADREVVRAALGWIDQYIEGDLDEDEIEEKLYEAVQTLKNSKEAITSAAEKAGIDSEDVSRVRQIVLDNMIKLLEKCISLASDKEAMAEIRNKISKTLDTIKTFIPES